LQIVADSFIFLLLPNLWPSELSKVFASVCGLLRLQNGKQTATFSGLMSGNQQQSVIMIQV